MALFFLDLVVNLNKAQPLNKTGLMSLTVIYGFVQAALLGFAERSRPMLSRSLSKARSVTPSCLQTEGLHPKVCVQNQRFCKPKVCKQDGVTNRALQTGPLQTGPEQKLRFCSGRFAAEAASLTNELARLLRRICTRRFAYKTRGFVSRRFARPGRAQLSCA